MDSTQTLHSDTDAAVLPGNTAPWLFSRTQYANGLGSAVRISPCRLTALALVRGVIRASAQSDLAMRELVLLTHAIQRRSSAGADCSWPALDARGGAPVWETPQAQAPPQRAAGSRKARAWASLARHRELGRSSSAPYSWLQISARRLNQKWPMNGPWRVLLRIGLVPMHRFSVAVRKVDAGAPGEHRPDEQRINDQLGDNPLGSFQP